MASSSKDTIAHLRSLETVRQRSQQVFSLAQEGQLEYFAYHPENEQKVVEYCAKVLTRDYGADYAAIPPHGRWNHIDAGDKPRVQSLIDQWTEKKVEVVEQARRLVDLFIVSVLVDAGAGNTWSYQETGFGDEKYARSEGLGVASFHIFANGAFSSDASSPQQCDAEGLRTLTLESMAKAFQSDASNPMKGLEGRISLLSELGSVVAENAQGFFSRPSGISSGPPRPGYLVDYILSHTNASKQVDFKVIWQGLLVGLAPIWPKDRVFIDGESIGDVWPCHALSKHLGPGASKEDSYVPFHKLTQWMTYSILVPLQKVLGLHIVGAEVMTGLPEYRNGGLLIDLGVLQPLPSIKSISQTSTSTSSDGIPLIDAKHTAIIEWRAMTVILLDRIHLGLLDHFQIDKNQLQLAQVLEAATWKSGRELAKALRPKTGGPPIEVISDGTIF